MEPLTYSLRNYLNRTIKDVRKYIGNLLKVPSRLLSKRYFKLAVSPAYGPQNEPYGLPTGRRRAISWVEGRQGASAKRANSDFPSRAWKIVIG